MADKMLRCAIYIRVSTAEQAMHGKSLAAQTEYLKKYAEDHHMAVTGFFADEGKTARKNFKNRKAIKQLLECVKRDEVDVIIFWKMDRWFRNISDFYKVQDILDAHGVKWIATAEPNMNMDTRDGRLNLNIMLSINQNETDTTSERIKFVNEASVRQGKVISGAQPIGYMVGIGEDGSKRVIKNPHREALVHEFFEYYLLHQSKRGTFVHLVEKYGHVISMRQVEILCSNTLYYGFYRNNPHYCPPYITKAQYEQIQAINQRNIKLYYSHEKTGEVYLFTGLIKCPLCGRPMSSNRSVKNSHNGEPLKIYYRYYRCQNWVYKKTCTYSKIPNEATIEKCLLKHIEEAKELRKQNESLKVSSIMEQVPPERKAASGTSLQNELERLNHMYQKGRITEEKYDSEYERLIAELQSLKEEPTPQPARSYTELETILCAGWYEMYEKLNRESKRAFWRSLIKEIYLNQENSFIRDFELL